MDDYESRVSRIRAVIRACLYSHEDDEDFFSASDGGEDSPPSSRSDQPAAEEGGNSFSAADGAAAACAASPVSIASYVAANDDVRGKAEAGCSPALPAHHERGPTPRTEHLLSTSSSSTRAAGPPFSGTAVLPDKGGGVAYSSRPETEEAPNPCAPGRRSASNTGEDSLAARTLAAECCGVVSFAGISVSGLRLSTKVSHHRNPLNQHLR